VAGSPEFPSPSSFDAVGAESAGAVEAAKRVAAESAAMLVEDGMLVGLGTGSTVAFLLPALASRHLQIRCVATSPATASAARKLGLEVLHFDRLDRLDVAIDGADQVTPDWWLVKGGGGAHTREKIVAAAAERFVVIVSPEKVVPRLEPPVPVELMAFGLESTLRLLPGAQVRTGAPHSPDGGVIADWFGDMDDLEVLAASLAAMPGVVEHGLFPPEMVTDVIVGSAPEDDSLLTTS
jgi:ribose 5-phosphate isomerase A